MSDKLIDRLRKASGQPANNWQDYISLANAEEIARQYEAAHRAALVRAREALRKAHLEHVDGIMFATVKYEIEESITEIDKVLGE